jgi:hypothetical protein
MYTLSKYRKRITAPGMPQPKGEVHSFSDRQERVCGFDQSGLDRAHGLFIGGGGNAELLEVLCRMGIGRATVVDHDVFEYTNLARQFAFHHRFRSDLQKPKAWRLIKNLAPHCTKKTVLTGISRTFEDLLVAGFDFTQFSFACALVDNGATRAAYTRHFQQIGLPLVTMALGHGNIGYIFIQESTPSSACLGCKLENEIFSKKASCAAPSSKEIVKVVAGFGAFAINTLLMPLRRRAWNWRQMSLNGFLPDECLMITKNPNCPICGDGKQ